jgi:hypothetical protein
MQGGFYRTMSEATCQDVYSGSELGREDVGGYRPAHRARSGVAIQEKIHGKVNDLRGEAERTYEEGRRSLTTAVGRARPP